MNRFVILSLLLFLSFFGFSQKADYRAADDFSEWKIRRLIGSLSVSPQGAEEGSEFWYKYKT